MLEGFRNGVFALGLIAGFAGTLVLNLWIPIGFDWWTSNISAPNQARYAQEQCERRQQGKPALSASFVDQAERATAGENAPQQDTDRPYYPDWCDLAAQQASAQAAVGMERTALWNTVLTLIGVALVGGTLHYTRRAAKDAARMVCEAKNANTVAGAAVEVARASMLLDKRPWLSVEIGHSGEPARHIIPDDHVVTPIAVALKNHGRSPAMFSIHLNAIKLLDRSNHDDVVSLARRNFTRNRDTHSIIFPDKNALETPDMPNKRGIYGVVAIPIEFSNPQCVEISCNFVCTILYSSANGGDLYEATVEGRWEIWVPTEKWIDGWSHKFSTYKFPLGSSAT